MDTISIKDGTVTVSKTVIETIDLRPLMEELKSLKVMQKPEDKNVLSMAKLGEIHPYYDKMTAGRINELEMEINRWLK